MALDEIPILTWKSKKKRAKEMADYEKWAFPYGEQQRENLIALLLEVFPGETVPTTMIPFLTCKELFDTAQETREHDDAIDAMINRQISYKKIIRKKDMATYLALVLVDAQVDETLQYPSADEVRKRAAMLEQLRRDE